MCFYLHGYQYGLLRQYCCGQEFDKINEKNLKAFNQPLWQYHRGIPNEKSSTPNLFNKLEMTAHLIGEP